MSTTAAARPIRLGCFAATPVHYQAPLYRRLAARPDLEFEVTFASDEGLRPYSDGWGDPITWNVDLVGGFEHRFLRRARRNGTARGFLSLRDLDVVARIRERRYDALWLHGYHTLTHVLASIAQRSTGGALFFREEQTLLQKRPLLKRKIKGALLPFYFRGAGGLFISSENRRWFERFGFDDSRLFFTPYCVDNDFFQREAARLAGSKPELRRRFGLPADQPVVLTACRLIGKKRVDRLVSAFALLRRAVPCSLLVAGSGPLAGELKAQVESLQLEDVAFAGFLNQDAIGEAYAAADVFVLTSEISETFGLVVNEAMNFGLPIVVSNRVGCAIDLVRDGENGFQFPAGDVGTLAARIEQIVRSPKLAAEMGRTSRELISTWTYDRTVEGILAGLGWALAR